MVQEIWEIQFEEMDGFIGLGRMYSMESPDFIEQLKDLDDYKQAVSDLFEFGTLKEEYAMPNLQLH